MKNKYKYLEEKAKEAIDYCVKNNTQCLMMVDGYQTNREALILRDFLWYARDNGVDVLMVPKEKDEKTV